MPTVSILLDQIEHLSVTNTHEITANELLFYELLITETHTHDDTASADQPLIHSARCVGFWSD